MQKPHFCICEQVKKTGVMKTFFVQSPDFITFLFLIAVQLITLD